MPGCRCGGRNQKKKQNGRREVEGEIVEPGQARRGGCANCLFTAEYE